MYSDEVALNATLRYDLSITEELTRKTTKDCLRQNGFCVPESECPAGKRSSRSGLCGANGMECCHAGKMPNLQVAYVIIYSGPFYYRPIDLWYFQRDGKNHLQLLLWAFCCFLPYLYFFFLSHLRIKPRKMFYGSQ